MNEATTIRPEAKAHRLLDKLWIPLNEATAIRPEAKAQRILENTYQQTKSLECESSLINLQAKKEQGGEVAEK